MWNGRRTYTAAELRRIEQPLLAAGVPLMRRAAEALAARVSALLRERGTPSGPVLLLVGGGDNGGDALYAGAELAASGVRVEVLRTASSVHERALAAALEAGAALLPETAGAARLAGRAAACALVVDGVLGLGAGGTAAGGSPALRGRAREIVAAVVRALERTPGRRPTVVAVDLPSGVDPDSGEVAEPASVLPADLTVTFIRVKHGLVREPGARFAGRIELETLGVDEGPADEGPADDGPADDGPEGERR